MMASHYNNNQHSVKSSSPRTFFTREIYCKAKLPSLLTAITEQKDDARQPGPPQMPSTPQEMILKFQSYATNIRRTRRIATIGETKVEPLSMLNRNNINDIPSFTILSKQSAGSMSAIRSLLYTLERETFALCLCQEQGDVLSYSQDTMIQLRDSLNHALIQALRASSNHGDYNMISKIVQGAISYCEAVARVMFTDESHDDGKRRFSMTRLLDARFFGEAITEMGKTQAGNSKLNKLWLTFLDVSRQFGESDNLSILASKPSAFELNAMISVLGSRGKVRAALKLYHEMRNGGMSCSAIECDEYTASALLNVLAQSIEFDYSSESLVVSSNSTMLGSPCWQWNEAMSILDDFEKNGKINNHVYCAALQVNEQAMVSYRFPGNKHHGSKFAMSILERMKVSMKCSFGLKRVHNVAHDFSTTCRRMEYPPMSSHVVLSCQHLTKENSGKRH
jgi:pentatricopeptide repeat protein